MGRCVGKPVDKMWGTWGWVGKRVFVGWVTDGQMFLAWYCEDQQRGASEPGRKRMRPPVGSEGRLGIDPVDQFRPERAEPKGELSAVKVKSSKILYYQNRFFLKLSS